jgi:presenilin-like A22 family membrane protease
VARNPPCDYREIMKLRIGPFLWGGLVMVVAMSLTLYVASSERVFVEVNQIASPNVSLAPVIGYFFGVVVLVGLVLFFIPLSKLRVVFRVLFALMFAWGVFVVTVLLLPAYVAYSLAVIAGIAWLFWARVWLHDLLLLLTLCGAGSIFGFLFSPWTFMIFMLIVAVYDIVAIRFGFMVWLADKLSEAATLPAFIFPNQIRDWNLNLHRVRVSDLAEKEPGIRDYAILGGGDIGFPLMLSVSVFFAADLTSGVVVGVFALVGLMVAFLIQWLWLKGKPMPALPPIAILSLIGFLVASAYLG